MSLTGSGPVSSGAATAHDPQRVIGGPASLAVARELSVLRECGHAKVVYEIGTRCFIQTPAGYCPCKLFSADAIALAGVPVPCHTGA